MDKPRVYILIIAASTLYEYMSIIATLSYNQDGKVHGANVGPTWVLAAPDGPHVGSMNLAIREGL